MASIHVGKPHGYAINEEVQHKQIRYFNPVSRAKASRDENQYMYTNAEQEDTYAQDGVKKVDIVMMM
jgi:hypothetical protein